MLPRPLTTHSTFGDPPRHPKLSPSKVKPPATASSPTLLFKTRFIKAQSASFNYLSAVKSGPPIIEGYSINDLVNILDSPGCVSESYFPWSYISLSPLHAVTNWLKHVLWIFTRPVPWNYPAQSREIILESETMREASERAAQQTLASNDSAMISMHDYALHAREAREILIQMASSTSALLIRIAAVVVNKIFRHSLSGIYVRQCQLSELQSLGEVNPDAPIVYLPLHRSHLDYILLTYLLYIRSMRAPQVAAGDNLNIPIFGRLLRGLGGFFIRRKLDHKRVSKNSPRSQEKDFIYRGVLQQFICEILAQGYPLEFYLEGGRSRNGRTLEAKAGLLSVLIHAYQKGFIQDAIIVPVAFTYDRLIEGNFVAEQRGSQKTKESFGHALRSIWRTITAHFGSVRIEFGQPFKLKRFLVDHAEKFGLDSARDFGSSGCLAQSEESLTTRISFSSSSLLSVVPSDEKNMNRLTLELASVVLHEANRCLALSAPNIVSYLMSTKFRRGCTETDLVLAMSNLCVDLTSAPKRKMLAFDDLHEENLVQLCRYSASVLPHLISRSESQYHGCSTIDQIIERHYYCGPVMEAFAGESVLAASLLRVLQEGDSTLFAERDVDSVEIDWESVETCAYDLAAILEKEFIQFQPAGEFKSVLQEAKKCLADWGLIEIKDVLNSSRGQICMSCNPHILQKLSDLRASIAPIIEGYSAVAHNLAHTFESSHSNICDRCLQHRILTVLQTEAKAGHFKYPEGCAKDTMLNSFKIFRAFGILKANDNADLKCQSNRCGAGDSSDSPRLNQISPRGVSKLNALRSSLDLFRVPVISV